MAEVVEVLLRARMEASGVETGVNQIKNSLKGLTLPKGITDDLEKSFSKLTPLLKDYQKQLNKGFSNKRDLQNFNALKGKIDEVFADIKTQVQRANSEQIRLKVDTQEIDRLEKQIASKTASLQKTLDSVVTKSFNFDSISKKFGEKTKGISSSTITAMWGKASEAFQTQDYIKYNQILDETRNKILSFSKIRFDFAKALGFDGKKTDIEDITNAIDTFFNSIKVNSGQVERISRTKEEIEKLKNTAKDLKFDSLGTGKKALEGLDNTLDGLIRGFKQTGAAATEAGNGMVRMSEEVNQLKTSTQYFFSLRNMINLFKRGVQEAVQTVKELDAAMTETAVVTKYSVADMWDKLPQYTAMANKLGGTIKGAYETTTLYYQQGLDTDAAMGIGEETIKMARIAGLDYAETTDMMTAALRGFNMELNSLSAQHINDVYSELAAKTASNTQEIGSAMERTASIAHSAGMSFEGTSAFLAQMIETTREAPENLGTAMKTIIARFQELKKDPMDMEEVDGELPDYNKVDTALKSIGVDLKNQRGEFRALDEVFLDIAKRWDSLDQRQQRYVATTAAGSRQQSRFIAMMNNYERTAELMEYANDSAGASQEQFNKTLDSFEAKANKLRNAWNRFLMGIADNQIIKGSLDILTNLVEGINDLIETVSGGFGPLKSFLSLFTAFIGLKFGGGLVNRLIGGLGGMLDPRSSFKKGFGVGATGFNSAQAAQFSNPIVAELEKIYGAITKTNTTSNDKITGKDYLKNYLSANKQFRAISKDGSTSVNKVADIFNTVDDNQGRLIFNNSRGTVSQLKRTFNTIFKKANLDDQMVDTGNELVKEMFKGVKAGEISAKEMASALVDPTKLGKIIGTDSAKEISNQLRKNLFGSKSNHFYKKALENLGKSNLTGNELKQYLKTNNAEVQAEVQKLKEQHIANQLGENGEVLIKQATASEKAANWVGHLGSAFSTAGQAASAFGMILNNMGLEAAGAAFMSLGNTISSVGMAINGVSGIISSIGIGPALAALAAIAVPVTIIAKAKIDESNIKEEAEKITKTYQDTIDRTTEKISGLEANKDILNNLSSGVDEFGNNVSLTNEEYEQFITASREVANLSPSLIKGYNAQGDAIVATGRALDERIAKEKELQEIAKRNYVSTSSLETLADAARVSDEFKKYSDKSFENRIANPQYAQSFIMPAYAKTNYSATSLAAEKLGQDSDFIDGVVKSSTSFSYMTKEVDGLNQALEEAREAGVDVNKIFEDLTGNKIDWENVGLEDIEKITNHSNDIIDRINEEYQTKMTEASKDINEDFETNLQEAFTPISEGYADLLSSAQTTIDALRQYLTSQHLDAEGLQLSEELVYGFNEGLNNIAIQGIAEKWTGEEWHTAAKDYAKEWDKLAGAASPYAEVMDKITKAKDEYDKHVGDADALENYNNAIDPCIEALETFKGSIDTSTLAGKEMVSMLDETIASAQGYADTVEFTLGDALNSMADEFEHARGAKEEFDKALEGGDYYTSANNFKEIYDTITSDENSAGNGSKAFWTGAEAMLGEDTLEEFGYDIDKIKAKLKELGPSLEEGAEGYNNFIDLLTDKSTIEGIDKFYTVTDGRIDFTVEGDEDLEKLADLLNIDVDLLSAFLDKMQQYADLDFYNPDEVKTALSQDERALQGSSEDYYVNRSVIKQEAENAGYRPDKINEILTSLSQNGIKILNAEDLAKNSEETNKFLKDVGLGTNASLEDAVKVFSKMDFSLDEAKNILSQEGVNVTGDLDSIDKVWAENAYAIENPTVAGIKDNTSGILSNTDAMLAAMGIMTDSMEEQIKKEISPDKQKETESVLKDEKGNIKTFDSDAEYKKAQDATQENIDKYKKLEAELQAGRDKATDAYTQAKFQEALDKTTEIRENLEQAKAASEFNWTAKVGASKSQLKEKGVDYSTLGAGSDQVTLDSNAYDYIKLLNGDLEGGLKQLEQISKTGDLSAQTIQNLGLALLNLNQVDSSKLEELDLSFLNLELDGNKLKSTLSQPFSAPKIEGADELKQHLIELGFTGTDTIKYVDIIFNPKLNTNEKVEGYLNAINEEFGGNNSTKVLVIQAAAEMAAGNDAKAEELLEQAFGADGQGAYQKLEVLCEGSIVNADEFKQGIQTAAESAIPEGGVEIDISANGIVENIPPVEVPVTPNTEGISSKMRDLITKTESEPAKMPLEVEDKASSIINEVHSNASTNEHFNIDATYIGPKEIAINKTITTKTKDGGSGAKGINNSMPQSESISFHSFAKGYNGPGRRGSKITALTGEKGYEVAWVPSERRSTILGLNGPEMATFPADTVIFDHEQSKRILKGNKNKPELGSFYVHGSAGRVDVDNYFASGSSGSSKRSSSSSKGSSKGSSKSSSSDDKHITINNFSIEEVVRFNAEKRIENYQHLVDNWMKDLDKALGKIGTRVSSVSSNLANQIDYLKSIKNQNNNLVDSYKRSLNQLAGGPYNTTISYNSGGESQQEDINLANYIYKDKWDNYQIDNSKIAGAGSKERQEAIFKAAESALSPLVSGLQKAQDAARAAQDAIDDLEKKIYDNFYGWENELTEIYHLTQRLENDSSLLDRFTSQVNLEIARLSAGFNTVTSAVQNSTAAMSRHTKTLNDQVKAQHQMITARQKELDAALTTQDELDKYLQIAKRHGADSGVAKQAEEEWKAANMAAGYVSNVVRQEDGSVTYNIDWAKFNKDQAANPINKETYEKIKAQLDNLNATSKAFNESIKDTTDLLDSIYDQLAEYQKTIADFEKTILDQLEKSIQEEIDNSKKLNDAIKAGFKDLLDQVRRKLDERRQKEDNAKTEQDIANKQQRLSLLRSSTNGSQVEIAQLEKEIGDAQQSYQRTLEDQLLARLQQQEDLAAKQREQQIALAQASLDVQRSSNAELVNMWLKDPVKYQEQLEAAWMKAQDYEGKGFHEQQLLRQEFTTQFTQLQTALVQTGELLNSPDNLTLKQLEASGANLTTLVSLVQTLEAEIAKKNIATNPTTKNTTDKTTNTSIKTTSKPAAAAKPAAKPAPKPAAPKSTAPAKKTYEQHGGSLPPKWPGSFTASYTKSIQKFLKAIGLYKDKIDGSYGPNTRAATKAFQKMVGIAQDSSFGPDTLAHAKTYKYKKGGLAPFTGPAWLDGTKSKPELVLNATDTKNFIQLKDILASTMRAGAFNTPVAVSGDTNYEININVDHINNDYDVDKIANRVKKIIVQDSSYRNVTSVRKFR